MTTCGSPKCTRPHTRDSQTPLPIFNQATTPHPVTRMTPQQPPLSPERLPVDVRVCTTILAQNPCFRLSLWVSWIRTLHLMQKRETQRRCPMALPYFQVFVMGSKSPKSRFSKFSSAFLSVYLRSWINTDMSECSEVISPFNQLLLL